MLSTTALCTECSSSCYGPLQADPLELIRAHLDLAAYNTMFLYPQPLANSSCKQEKLASFNFCYRAILSQGVVKPVFTIALLQDTGSEYIVRHIYREMEDRDSCLRDSKQARCCKWVTVERNLPLTVNSSFALAVVTSTSGSSLYETGEFSSGVAYSSPPALLGAVGSRVVGVERKVVAGQIPVLFIRIVLTEMVHTKSDLNWTYSI